MKAIITNYRYWVLTLLALLSFIGGVAIPQDNVGFWPYIAILFGSKIVALIALIACCILYLHWQDNDKIPELTELIKD